MQWKQWCTDETWSPPVQILKRHEMPRLGEWLPNQTEMQFPSGGQANLDWISKVEAWCAAQPSASKYNGLDRDLHGCVEQSYTNCLGPMPRAGTWRTCCGPCAGFLM